MSDRHAISQIRNQIRSFRPPQDDEEVGSVLEMGDGIARASGLSKVMVGEIVEFPRARVNGLALNLERASVGIVVMGDCSKLVEGDLVRRTRRIASIPVGDGLRGRVVDALGHPIDGKGPIAASRSRNVEHLAPNIIHREPINQPLYTGIKAIDAMFPIGRGQRELIIGDRQTGKTTLALDTIINQKDKKVDCIYVAIAQKLAHTAEVVATLEQHDAMQYTTVMVASAADPVALQFIAPYAGCAMGEDIMEQGRDALVVYDDLTKHAWAYRQISLLLRRPPGHEAYPGDIFYLHARLLERSAKLSPDSGGGSLTALPIVETQAGDITAYIPTNLISMTDGQLYLDRDLFNAGTRPAVDVRHSVSRVGSKAQTPAMRQVAERMRLELAQYHELEDLTKYGFVPDNDTREQLERGRLLTELLMQGPNQPVRQEHQVMVLYAATHGYLDDVPTEQVSGCEARFLEFMDVFHEGVGYLIQSECDISFQNEAALRQALREFKERPRS